MKYTEQKVFLVSYSEIRKTVAEYYGFEDYSLAYEEDWIEDTYQLIEATNYLTDKQQEQLNNIGKKYPRISTLLSGMAIAGAIPEGRYLVNVSW